VQSIPEQLFYHGLGEFTLRVSYNRTFGTAEICFQKPDALPYSHVTGGGTNTPADLAVQGPADPGAQTRCLKIFSVGLSCKFSLGKHSTAIFGTNILNRVS